MRKYLLGIFALVVGIAFSAFTVSGPVNLAGEKWYELRSGGDPSNANDYFLYGDGSVAPNCLGTNVCGKYAIPDSQNPNIPNLNAVAQTVYRPMP